MINTY